MNITYDSKADAAYMYLGESSVVKTIPVSESVFIDLDAEGTAVGIEILGVSEKTSLLGDKEALFKPTRQTR